MANENDLNAYKWYARKLCIYAAEVQRFSDAAREGKKIDRRCLTYALAKLKGYRRFTLQSMNMLGIKGGIDFMEDNEFIGFSIKQGRLYIEDDRDVVLYTCKKWAEGFPDEANYYQYAVAMYCIALAFPDVLNLEDLYPEYMLKGLPRPEEGRKAA